MAKAKSKTSIDDQPVAKVEWVKADSIEPNDYNPNVQPPPEHRLLKISISEEGWTQPIVVFDAGDGGKPVIVDGEHRWRCGMDPDVAKLTGGLVPIVRISGDRHRRMMATIRHNRARGEHAVLPMASIVRYLIDAKIPTEEIGFLLQMESEEIDRLAERAGMPVRVGRETPEFGNGWVPVVDQKRKAAKTARKRKRK